MLVALAAHDGGEVAGGPESLLRHGFRVEPKFRIILAEEDGALLGLVLFFPEYSSWRGQTGAYIQDLYVAEAARGQGLGRALLAEVARAALDWQASFITLMVQRGNRIGQGFYAAQGFEMRGDSDWLVLEGEAWRQMTALSV